MFNLIYPLLILLSGCAITSYNPTNIIDITDEQWLEDGHGEVCKESEMLIYPDHLEYYYPGCSIKRVVKVKPHLIPTPAPKPH